MYYDRASIGIEERRRAGRQRHAIRGKRKSAAAVRPDLKVWGIASMRASRVAQSVLPVERIVVPGRGRERSRSTVAPPYRVKVNSVRARSEIGGGNIDVYESTRVLPEFRGSDRATVPIRERRARRRHGMPGKR